MQIVQAQMRASPRERIGAVSLEFAMQTQSTAAGETRRAALWTVGDTELMLTTICRLYETLLCLYNV